MTDSLLLAARVLLASFCMSHQAVPTVPTWTGEGVNNNGGQAVRLYISKDEKDVVVLVHQQKQTKMVPIVVPINIRFDPLIQVTVTHGDNGLYQYSYRVANGKAARDPICSLSMVVSPSIEMHAAQYSDENSSIGWLGGTNIPIIAPQSEVLTASLGRYVSWTGKGYDELLPSIKPGTSRSGFRIQTKLIPGMTTLYLGGAQFWPGEDAYEDADISQTPVCHFPRVTRFSTALVQTNI